MNGQPRKVDRIITPQAVTEGAGVKLKRSIATRTLDYVDPFLLFDHFASDNPADYLAGFPMHPHRGIETVTYMLAGAVRHRDSIGNSGTIEGGDVQWMTAGGGILHEEMPEPRNGKMAGFQLWVNLPARLKMMAPRYQEIRADEIPVAARDDGTAIRVIAGRSHGVHGPVTEIAAEPTYLDVTLPPNTSFHQPVEMGHTALAYVFEGSAGFGVAPQDDGSPARHPALIIFEDGDHVAVRTTESAARFLFISGAPLYESIARYGPFVMNTREEILQALKDLQDGTFVR